MLKTTTESLLRQVPVESTATYTAIPHSKVIDDVRFFSQKFGLKITNEFYTECNDGKIAQGQYQISSIKDEEMCLQFIWQNSTNRQVSFKFAAGSFVFV